MMKKIISIILIISLLFTLNNLQGINEDVQNITGIKISMALQVNVTTLNVRAGPGTNYSIIGQVSYSAIFYAFERALGTNISGNPYWYHIYWNGKTGWVSGYYLVKPYLPSSDLGFGVEIRNTSLNVYGGPGNNYAVIGNAFKGQIYILASHSLYNGNGGDFLQIYYNNQSYGFTGFIPYSGVSSVKLQYFENGYVKRLVDYNNAYVSLRKVIFPYIYPVYNGYVNDLRNYSIFISGLHYEEYYLTSSLTLGDWGDGGVGSNASLYDIPKWPMIVNNYNSSRTSLFLSDIQAQNNFINSAVSAGIINHYAGYSIDFEGTSGYTLTDAKNYIIFLNNFADALHSHGMKLAVAPQPAYNGQPNSLLDYYIYNPFTQIRVDYIMPQCYEGYFSSYYPYDFIGAVQSIMNAVGPYLSINQIVILLMTTNPNTNSYFSMQEMNERIYYIERMGINGIGIWSMNQQGGFPQSQYLWQQLADFEYMDSEWFNYRENLQYGSFSLFSYADGKSIGYKLIGSSGQNVPCNGTISQIYKSYSPITSVVFNASIFLPSNFTFYIIGKDNSGTILNKFSITKSGQYSLNFTGAYEIDFNLSTSSNNFVKYYFNNPTILYIGNISLGFSNTYTDYVSAIGMTCDNNYPSYVRYAVQENYGWTAAQGIMDYKIVSSVNIINAYFKLQNNQSISAVNVSLFAVSSTGGILAEYYFINNNMTPFSSMNFSFQFPKGTRYIEFQVSSQFNILNSTWQIMVNDIKINLGLNYNVTFLEKGLPAYTKWYVNLSNGQSFTGTGTRITFSEPNGSYSFSIATVNKIYEPNPESGTFTVNGNSVEVSITFNPVTYKVTFNETGLPSGIKWYVNLSSGESYSGNGTVITFTEVNGTYSYRIETVNKNYAPVPSSGEFTVNGNSVNVSITFNLVTYTIKFTESGLSAGATWSVTLGGTTQSSITDTIAFKEPNGTYTYAIGAISGYVANPSSGKIVVNGTDVNQGITFTQNGTSVYEITFTEGGLPAGTKWFINLSNGQSFSSTSSTIKFNEPNGSYSYRTETTNGNYEASPQSGTFTVNGANVTVMISFNRLYSVTFVEDGLPLGTKWYVNLSNGGVFSTTTNKITFREVNGTYFYSISTVNRGYAPSPQSGTFTLKGNNLNISIKFNLETFKITFTESGLPSGTEWYVNLSNGQSFSSATNTITFSEPNGTYSYTIETVNKNYAPNPSSGTFTPLTVNVAITFNLVTYTITFKESGLPSGTEWYVNLTNGQIFSSTAGTITLTEPNGTYSYYIATMDKSYRPSSYYGTFTVNGESLDLAIKFVSVTYRVKFTETGLPSGSKWYVNISSGQVFSSITYNITFMEQNGTYSYTVYANDRNYVPFPCSGKFMVDGKDVNVSIMFIPNTYKVTFVEEGLSPGSQWGIYLNNGMYQRSTNSTITFNLKNGTYYYQVVYPSGYVMNGLSNKIVINGSSLTIKLTFVTKNSGGSYFNYIIYLVIISATIFLSIFLIRRRER
jgi:hypothetical protein